MREREMDLSGSIANLNRRNPELINVPTNQTNENTSPGRGLVKVARSATPFRRRSHYRRTALNPGSIARGLYEHNLQRYPGVWQ